MSEAVASERYTDSGELIAEGDEVLLDGHPARVEGILLPGTREAENYYSEDTGALALVLSEGNIPVVIPFGNYCVITKSRRGPISDGSATEVS